MQENFGLIFRSLKLGTSALLWDTCLKVGTSIALVMVQV